MHAGMHPRRQGHRIAVGALGLALAAIAVHWGWNTTATTLFGLPEARFVQSFAGLLGIVAVAAAAGYGASLGSGRNERQSESTTK